MAIQAQLYPENMGLPLCGSQDWLILDNNGRSMNDLVFNLQPQQQQQQQQQFVFQLQNQKFQKNQFPASENAFLHHPSCETIPATTTAFTTSSSAVIDRNNNVPAAASASTTASNNDIGNLFSTSFTQPIACHFEKQRQEMDAFITFQNQSLKLALQEQSRRQYASLTRAIEARAAIILKQKEEEVARASKRAADLDEFVRKLEAENQLWKKAAADSEAMILSLNTTIHQLREKPSFLASNVADDAESCCCVQEDAWEKIKVGGGGGGDVGKQNNKTMMCRRCNTRKSSVLFFPCRHLCSCKDCEAFLDACPLCKSAKQAIIEALFS